MKRLIATFIAFTLLSASFAQESGKDKKLPGVQLKDMNGKVVNTAELAAKTTTNRCCAAVRAGSDQPCHFVIPAGQ